MYKTTLTVDGMMCGMCEAHVGDAIRKAVPKAKKVSVSRGKKTATFLTEEPADTELVKAAINETGYDCTAAVTEPYEKKGLFGR